MNFKNIKLVCLDLDGCLTDGLYHVLDNGVTMKSFYTRDFYAIHQLKHHGINVLILTQSFGKCIQAKLDNLIDTWKDHIELAVRVDNKLEFLHEYITKKSLTWENVAYMGDAENDIDCMKTVGITACPSDAIELVKNESHFISDHPGGRGAVYNFIMHLLKNRTV